MWCSNKVLWMLLKNEHQLICKQVTFIGSQSSLLLSNTSLTTLVKLTETLRKIVFGYRLKYCCHIVLNVWNINKSSFSFITSFGFQGIKRNLQVQDLNPFCSYYMAVLKSATCYCFGSFFLFPSCSCSLLFIP